MKKWIIIFLIFESLIVKGYAKIIGMIKWVNNKQVSGQFYQNVKFSSNRYYIFNADKLLAEFRMSFLDDNNYFDGRIIKGDYFNVNTGDIISDTIVNMSII